MLDFVELSPGRKAQKTAKWARTMTKWLITRAGGARTKWKFVEFGGPTGCESRGIVDILAIRKDHGENGDGLKRGDRFEIILIQTKGGCAPRPMKEDVERLSRVARLYHAKAVVLAQWKKGVRLQLYRLSGNDWRISTAKEIFGIREEPDHALKTTAIPRHPSRRISFISERSGQIQNRKAPNQSDAHPEKTSCSGVLTGGPKAPANLKRHRTPEFVEFSSYPSETKSLPSHRNL